MGKGTSIYGQVLKKVGVELPQNPIAMLRCGTSTVHQMMEILMLCMNKCSSTYDENAEILERFTSQLADWAEKKDQDYVDAKNQLREDYRLYLKQTSNALQESIGDELKPIREALDEETLKNEEYKGSVDSPDYVTEPGIYFSKHAPFGGLLIAVGADALYQILLTMNKPSYDEDGNMTLTETPCIITRKKEGDAWGAWSVYGDASDDTLQKIEKHEQDITNLKKAVDDLSNAGYRVFDSEAASLFCVFLRNAAYATSKVGQEAATALIEKFEGLQKGVVSIVAEWTGGEVYVGHEIKANDIKVTATFQDGHNEVVSGYVKNMSVLRSTTNNVKITYGGVSTTLVVTAIFNAIVEMVSVSTTQERAAIGQSVDKGCITYTVRYANGDVEELSDPNIINVNPSIIESGENEIEVSLIDYPDVKGTIHIIGGENSVTSAEVIIPYKPGQGSNLNEKTVVFDTPMTVAPNSIVITSERMSDNALGVYAIHSGSLTAMETMEGQAWTGELKRGSNYSNPTTVIVHGGVTLNYENGLVVGATLGPWAVYQNTYPGRWYEGVLQYTIKFEYV